MKTKTESVKRLMDAIIKLHPTFDMGNPLQEECYLAYHNCKSELQALEQPQESKEDEWIDVHGQKQGWSKEPQGAEAILNKYEIFQYKVDGMLCISKQGALQAMEQYRSQRMPSDEEIKKEAKRYADDKGLGEWGLVVRAGMNMAKWYRDYNK